MKEEFLGGFTYIPREIFGEKCERYKFQEKKKESSRWENKVEGRKRKRPYFSRRHTFQEGERGNTLLG